MLTNTLQDPDLLKILVVAFFDPATRDNAAMRQALSYFLPVYCHSRHENQERMGGIAVAVVHSVMGIAEDLDDEVDSADDAGKGNMVGLTTVVAMLADWTDGRKVVRIGEGGRGLEERPGSEKAVSEGPNSDVHLEVVRDVLEKVLRGSCSRECYFFLYGTYCNIFLAASSIQSLTSCLSFPQAKRRKSSSRSSANFTSTPPVPRSTRCLWRMGC